MMEDLSKALADVALAGIGLTTIVVEKTGEIVKECAQKGAETLEKSRAAGAEWKEKAEAAAKEGRERCKQDYLERMTAQEREALRQTLLDLDRREAEAASAAAEAAKIIDISPNPEEHD